MSKGWSQWWRVCMVRWHEDGSGTITPIGQPYARRQWALEGLLILLEDNPEGAYVIVETDDKPSWDVGSYGPRQGDAQQEAAAKAHGWR